MQMTQAWKNTEHKRIKIHSNAKRAKRDFGNDCKKLDHLMPKRKIDLAFNKIRNWNTENIKSTAILSGD